MKKQFLSIIIFVLMWFVPNAYGQSFNCPEIDISGGVDTLLLNCASPNSCTNISTTLPDIRQTVNGPNAYMVQSIPFAQAQSFNLTNANPILVNIDDRYSAAINLPFTFCFYGGSYNSIVVGANGTLSFNMAYANQPSNYELCDPLTSQNYLLPIANTPSMPINAIYALYHDIDPSITNPNRRLEWKVIGNAPCRKMVINWVEINHYRPNFSSCQTMRSTFQCVLYENTNVIDIFVKEKPTCASWNCGAAVIGIQNSTGHKLLRLLTEIHLNLP